MLTLYGLLSAIMEPQLEPTLSLPGEETKRLNFSVLERNILLRLIEENIEIVESKKNDGMTVRRKDEAWARIVSRFNAEPNVAKRTHRQLRKYWNNLKMRNKKSISTNGYAALALPTASGARSKTNSRTLVPRRAAIRGWTSASTSDGVLPESGIKDEPVSSPLRQHADADIEADTDRSGPPVVLLEARLDIEEAEPYPGSRSNGDDGEPYPGSRSNGDDGDREGDYEDALDSDSREIGEDFQGASDKNFRHETAARAMDDNNSQWTAMDYARSEHEAKMALLTIQMETAHEQRELAREMRDQTRQRHRLEMQVLEEKRRYRRMKMNTLPPHGQS